MSLVGYAASSGSEDEDEAPAAGKNHPTLPTVHRLALLFLSLSLSPGWCYSSCPLVSHHGVLLIERSDRDVTALLGYAVGLKCESCPSHHSTGSLFRLVRFLFSHSSSFSPRPPLSPAVRQLVTYEEEDEQDEVGALQGPARPAPEGPRLPHEDDSEALEPLQGPAGPPPSYHDVMADDVRRLVLLFVNRSWAREGW